MKAVIIVVVLCVTSAACASNDGVGENGFIIDQLGKAEEHTHTHISLGATSPDDVSAVKALYNSTDGPHWMFNDGWMDGDPCAKQWKGLTCDSVEGETRIVRVLLDYNYLRGTIPSEMLKLTKLRWLTLSYNSLSGTLPSGIFQFKSLGMIDLSGCSLEGSLSLHDNPHKPGHFRVKYFTKRAKMAG